MIAFVGAATLAVLLAACGVYRPEVADVTPLVPSTFVAVEEEVADIVEMDVPEGWVLQRKGNDMFPVVIVSPDGSTDQQVATIHISLKLPSVMWPYYAVDEDTFDLDKVVLPTIRERMRDHAYTDVQLLPARFVDGNPARGYTYVQTDEETGSPQRREYWEVGRHDGRWSISIVSDRGQTELPPELDGILDTVTWRGP
ncbi:hypothetical protein [Actinobaculum sp. 352]|uniref:hypothetical protein n=1 Tax=Actinobaculum sp. 352 TaxID=2490946 RepID=UPI000F7E440B|nr:hypothetical protein [Actinobaculum sp. 352]RTE47683.1 hypothetical protein EKN07_12255 [Actinobaculum sp. 352]